MTPADYRLLVESIQRHEGLSLHPTPDVKGTLVIGYGRNLMRTGVSRTEADYLLDNDLADRFATVPPAWKPFADCDGPRQRALMELAFQEGVGGLLLFHKMLHAIAVKDYETAAREVLNSTLPPSRARDYAETLRT